MIDELIAEYIGNWRSILSQVHKTVELADHGVVWQWRERTAWGTLHVEKCRMLELLSAEQLATHKKH